MSVQLILYPQNYEGQYSTISTPFFNQYVSNFSFNSQYSVAYNMSSATNLPLDFLESALPQNYWSLFYSTGGVYGTAKVSIKTYGDDKLFGTVQTDEIITGRLQHITGGLYARFQGNSMSVNDRWDIEVRSAGLINTNSPIKNIRIKRGKY